MLFMQLCVRSMASLETIGPLMTGMKCRPDMAGLACEALNRMFQKEQTELVAQVNFGTFFLNPRIHICYGHCIHGKSDDGSSN